MNTMNNNYRYNDRNAKFQQLLKSICSEDILKKPPLKWFLCPQKQPCAICHCSGLSLLDIFHRYPISYLERNVHTYIHTYTKV